MRDAGFGGNPDLWHRIYRVTLDENNLYYRHDVKHDIKEGAWHIRRKRGVKDMLKRLNDAVDASKELVRLWNEVDCIAPVVWHRLSALTSRYFSFRPIITRTPVVSAIRRRQSVLSHSKLSALASVP